MDAGKARCGLVLGGFSRALEAVSVVGTFGAKKYSDGGWQYVPLGIDRYTDAMQRHYLKESTGETLDPEGQMHAAQVAWNALARLELMLREQEFEERGMPHECDCSIPELIRDCDCTRRAGRGVRPARDGLSVCDKTSSVPAAGGE